MSDDENKLNKENQTDINAKSQIETDIAVAEDLMAAKIRIMSESDVSDDDFDDNFEEQGPIVAAAQKSRLISFLTDRNTLLALGAFSLIGASSLGYIYYTTMQQDVLSNPGIVKMATPPVNIAKGSVPIGTSPLVVMKKEGELSEKSSEMISPNIVSEILNVDDKAIENNKVDIKNSILTEVIPEDKKAKEEKLEMEKELRLAKARAILEQHKLKLEEAEIEALAFEMAKEEAESTADTAKIEDILRDDVALDEAFSDEKAKQAKVKEEADKKKQLAEAQKIVNELAKKDEVAKKAELAKAEANAVKEGGTLLIDSSKEVEEDLGPSDIDLENVADAELAIIQNATILDTLPAPSEVPLDPREKIIPDDLKSMQGKTVGDILALEANVRPLPQQYVVVKKEREAEDIESQLTAALSALGQNRYVAALEIFNNIYREHPDNAKVLMGRAVSMQKLGQHAAALGAYEDVLRVDPRNLEALTNMLGILKEQDSQTALFNLKQLRDLYPYNADITAQLGMIYGMVKDYPNAIKYLDMADALKPNDMNILYNKAVAYDKMGESRLAADIYRKIVYRASLGEVERTFPIDAVKRRLASIR